MTNVCLLPAADMTATDQVNVFVKIDGKAEYLVASLDKANRSAKIDIEFSGEDKVSLSLVKCLL